MSAQAASRKVLTVTRMLLRAEGTGCKGEALTITYNQVRGVGSLWYECGMAFAAVDVRSVAQLCELSDAGEQPKYLYFWGHRPQADGGVGKGCLSQWWPAPFTVDAVVYPSAEHFMMAGKALLFGDSEVAEQIVKASHPSAAKALGRQVRGFR